MIEPTPEPWAQSHMLLLALSRWDNEGGSVASRATAGSPAAGPRQSEYRIAVVVGSLRGDSLNRQLANVLCELGPAGFSFRQTRIDDLPLYNQDDDANQAASVKRFKAEIADARGVIFVTPEYNRSIPGVLKNAIDHASRPHGGSVWAGKPAGIAGVSIGAMGTSMAQQHLRNVLACLDVPTLGLPEVFIHAREGFFDNDGKVPAASRTFLQSWMDHYIAWVRQHAAL